MRFLRRLFCKVQSNLVCEARYVGDPPVANQRVELRGYGMFEFGKNVVFGWERSPAFLSAYAYLDARFKNSVIRIGDNCIFSNDVAVISEHEGTSTSISIGRRCVFGVGFRCYDSDFHGLKAEERHNRRAIKTSPILIGDDVFFGERCMVLKGVQLGSGCVVGAGSVVTKSFPPNSLIAGNPARLIREIQGSAYAEPKNIVPLSDL